ncbi:MAG: hypothetical protein K9G37_02010 [Crocinitomicaceae bacterium]|nr:hypothetical protein [Crocinitomicaceae bacterium]
MKSEMYIVISIFVLILPWIPFLIVVLYRKLESVENATLQEKLKMDLIERYRIGYTKIILSIFSCAYILIWALIFYFDKLNVLSLNSFIPSGLLFAFMIFLWSEKGKKLMIQKRNQKLEMKILEITLPEYADSEIAYQHNEYKLRGTLQSSLKAFSNMVKKEKPNPGDKISLNYIGNCTNSDSNYLVMVAFICEIYNIDLSNFKDKLTKGVGPELTEFMNQIISDYMEFPDGKKHQINKRWFRAERIGKILDYQKDENIKRPTKP